MVESWDLYRTLLAVAREGTLARAAASLGSSVSTVHRQLAELEAALDTRIFERQGRGQVLTAAGEALVERAGRIEEEVLAIGREVVGRDMALRGRVVLTTTDTIAEALLARYLPEIRARYPDIHLHVYVDNRHFRLGRGEADIALRPGPRPEELDVVARQVAEVALSHYASRDYVRRRGRPRRKLDLRSHDSIVPDESLAHVIYGRIAAERTDEARHVLVTPSLLVQAMAVCAGVGIAALPCFLMDTRPNVVRLFAPEREGPLHLLYHADLRRTARVRVIVELLTELIEADAELIGGRSRP